VHDEDLVGLERARSGEHVRKQGPTRKTVQHLGQRRVHALALTGGEHDHNQLHGEDSSTRVPANSLKNHVKVQ
jgi:hypothetical protein